MIAVVLVRHGAVEGNGCCYGQRYDLPLSDEGQRQAQAIAARLRSPAQLVCSPALRARETAAAWPGEIRIDPRWAERDFGAWETRPWSDCWAEAPQALTGVDAYTAFTPPDGEPLTAVVRRVSDALEDLAEPTLVVTHGGPIRVALRHALGLSWAQAFAFDPQPGTATVLWRVESRWKVGAVGCGEGALRWES